MHEEPNVEQLNIIPNNSNSDDINSNGNEDAEETAIAECGKETDNEEEVNRDDNESRGEVVADNDIKQTRNRVESVAVENALDEVMPPER